MTADRKKFRGFASITLERRKEIARMGGLAAHRNGTAYHWTPETARIAGKKGGLQRGANALAAQRAGGHVV